MCHLDASCHSIEKEKTNKKKSHTHGKRNVRCPSLLAHTYILLQMGDGRSFEQAGGCIINHPPSSSLSDGTSCPRRRTNKRASDRNEMRRKGTVARHMFSYCGGGGGSSLAFSPCMRMYTVHRKYIDLHDRRNKNDIRVAAPHVIDIVLILLAIQSQLLLLVPYIGFSKQGTEYWWSAMTVMTMRMLAYIRGIRPRVTASQSTGYKSSLNLSACLPVCLVCLVCHFCFKGFHQPLSLV